MIWIDQLKCKLDISKNPILNDIYKAVSAYLKDKFFIKKLYKAIINPNADVNKLVDYIRIIINENIHSFF